jgi:16S rRNA (uracil1498-N3)-methyltransferase
VALPRFYVGNNGSAALVRKDYPYSFNLPDTAAGHIRVLRLALAENIVLFDGAGGEFTAQLLDVAKKSVTVSVLGHLDVERESPVHVVVVQALAVGDKMDWIVQKSCELGVTEIIPLQTERCTLRLSGERADKRVSHWQQIAIAASEQCGRNRIAHIAAISDFMRWLSSINTNTAYYFMLHPQDDCTTLVGALKALPALNGTCSPIYLLIGPEGGFSPVELQAAQAAGVIAVRFGARVLRTETAAASALAAIGAVIGDLQ